jgi:hypothetical protein
MSFWENKVTTMDAKIGHGSKGSAHFTAERRVYRIRLRGELDPIWINALDPLSQTTTRDCTLLEVLVDQSALRALLNRLWDLNRDVLSVAVVPAPEPQNGGK